MPDVTTLLVSVAVIVLIVLLYRPIMRQAWEDMARRSQAGLSNSYVYAILLFPILGPLMYLLVRKSMLPPE